MTPPATRYQRRRRQAARWADRTGSGPDRSGRAPDVHPGARDWFSLWGEVLLVGVGLFLLALPVLTLPVALAVGAGHLRRHLRAEDNSLRLCGRDLRAALPGGLVVGAGATGLAAAAGLTIRLARLDGAPGGPAIAILGAVGMLFVATAVALAAGAWRPDSGWTAAVGGLRRRLETDPAGCGLVAFAVVGAVLLAWQSIVLTPAGCGLVAFAVVAVEARRRKEGS
ncbi:MAG: hypothetical protein LBJ44_06075 [Propionibacteriaceae bacterium]|jgi:hypothetical protein|nr:hypothetical protein [Propionibacteriaceae bacterium]